MLTTRRIGVDATTWVAIGSLGTCASALFVAYQAAAQVWLTAELSHFGPWNVSADPDEIFPVHGTVGRDLRIRAYVRALAENRSDDPVRLTLHGQLPVYTLHPHQNWMNPDNDAVFSSSLDDSPQRWLHQYLRSTRHYLQLRPGDHVFIHYRTYLTFDAWRFQFYRRNYRQPLEPLAPLARACVPREVLSKYGRRSSTSRLLDLDLGPGFQLVCDNYEAERLATVWTVRIRCSAVTPADFDDDSRTWRWKLADPPPWGETSANDLYCGYQLVPVSRRISGSEILFLPGQE